MFSIYDLDLFTNTEPEEFCFLLRAFNRAGECVDLAYAVTAIHKNVAERVAQSDFEKRTGLKPRHMMYNKASINRTRDRVEMVVPVSVDNNLFQTILSPSLQAIEPQTAESAPIQSTVKPKSATSSKNASHPPAARSAGKHTAQNADPKGPLFDEFGFPDFQPDDNLSTRIEKKPDKKPARTSRQAVSAALEEDVNTRRGEAANCFIRWNDVREREHPGRGEDKTALICVKRPMTGKIVLADLARWNGRNWICHGKKIHNVAYWAHKPDLPEVF